MDKKLYHLGGGEVVLPKRTELADLDKYGYLDSIQIYAYCEPSLPVGWIEGEEVYQVATGFGTFVSRDKEYYDSFSGGKRIWIDPTRKRGITINSGDGFKTEQPDQFVKKHLKNIMSKTADLFIKNHIEIMWGGLEMASIQHFVYTGKVNGSFRQRLTEMLEGFAANWHNTAAEKQSSQLEESHIKAREMSAKEIEELKRENERLKMDNLKKETANGTKPVLCDVFKGKIATLKEDFLPESEHWETGYWHLKKGTQVYIQGNESDGTCYIEYIESVFSIDYRQLNS